jgi:hypothetical protein
MRQGVGGISRHLSAKIRRFLDHAAEAAPQIQFVGRVQPATVARPSRRVAPILRQLTSTTMSSRSGSGQSVAV